MSTHLEITRRQWVSLVLLIMGGILTAALLRAFDPPGRDIGERQIVTLVLEDSASPNITPKEYDLTIAVFSDYRCAACRSSDLAMERAVESDGRVRIIYKEWPTLGLPSRDAALVALAAEKQGRYSEIRAELMTSSLFDATSLAKLLTRSQTSSEDADDLLQAHSAESNRILDRVSREAFALGLKGTPSYLAGTILVEGALDENEFHRLFRRARSIQNVGE